jgi:hypothetical protein
MTLKATIRPIGSFNPRSLNQFYRVGHLGYQKDDEQNRMYNQRYNPELSSNPYGPNIDQNIDQRYQSNSYQDQYVVERDFNFDEWHLRIPISHEPVGAAGAHPIGHGSSDHRQGW